MNRPPPFRRILVWWLKLYMLAAIAALLIGGLALTNGKPLPAWAQALIHDVQAPAKK